MRIFQYIPLIIFLLGGVSAYGQCTREVDVVFTSITYKAGCDFGDSGGLDPVIEIFRNGNLEFMMYFDDQNQVTGPVQEVPIDLNADRNWCPPTYGDRMDLGKYSYTVSEIEVMVDIYEKDSRQVINRECDGYDSFWDDDYSTGIHTFDLNANSGSIDLGGCMVYNYILDKKAENSITEFIEQDICLDDTLWINNNPYYFGNSVGTEMVSDPILGCDTTYIIDLEFHSTPPIQIIEKPDILCPNDSARIEIRNFFQFETWNWDTGSTDNFTDILGGGDYSVTIGTNDGCEEIYSFFVDTYDSPTLELNGNPTLCNDVFTEINVITNGDSISWNTGENSSTLTITDPGIYRITSTNTATGCETIDSIEIIEFSEPEFSILGDSIFCAGGNTTLALDTTFTSVEWNDGSTGNTIDILQGGIYKVTVTDMNGCTTSEEIMIMEADPEIQERDSLSCDDTDLGFFDTMITDADGCNIIQRLHILYDTISICNINYTSDTENETCQGSQDGMIILSITEAQIPLSYKLINNEGDVIQQDLINDISTPYIINSITEGNYKIELENIHGIKEIIDEVVIADTLEYILNEDALIKPGESATLEMTIDTSLFEQYYWEIDGQSICGTSCISSDVMPDTTTTYTAVLFSNDLLCVYREDVTISVESNRAVYIPNLISPNLPQNDIFKIEGPDIDAIETFSVYDRWGNLVYSNNEITEGWDGRIDDSFAAEGVYLYVATVRFSDKTKLPLSGSITVLH